MGILNVTPDSFSDGGRYVDVDAAIRRGLEMVEEGADVLDIGGESTRPGAEAVTVEGELERVVPVVKGLAAQTEATLSIDTMKAEVARAALDGGARIINDVSALTADPDMSAVAKEYGAGVVLMHMRGTPRNMQADPRYDEVVTEVSDYLGARATDLCSQGLARASLAIDPGIGFGKALEHNLALLASLERLERWELPIVVGLSRKSFIGKLTGSDVQDRLAGSLGALAFCVLNGADVMRVHDVKASCDAARIAMALAERKERSENRVG